MSALPFPFPRHSRALTRFRFRSTRKTVTLPVEILELILDQLGLLHDPHNPGVLATLVCCCLVSKALLGPARRRLYAKVELVVEARPKYRVGCYEEEEEEEPDQYERFEEEEVLQTGAKELEMTLVCSPHLVVLVKQVDVVYLHRPVCAVRTPTLALANVLRSCPYVRRVEIDVRYPSPLDAADATLALAEVEILPLLKVLEAGGTSIRELQLHMLRPSTEAAGAAMADLLATLSELVSLDVRGTLGFGRTEPQGLVGIEVLKVTILASSEFASHVSLADFFPRRASAISLRSLSINSLGASPELDLGAFINLDRLEWDHLPLEDEYSTISRIRTTISSLSVRHLVIQPRQAFYSLLQPSLETLWITPPPPNTLFGRQSPPPRQLSITSQTI